MYSYDPLENRKFTLPTEKSDKSTYDFIQDQKKMGRKIVVVIGLGFVGAATCCVVSNAKDKDGKALYGVIGLDLATKESFWKIALVNSGICPIKADDPLIEEYFKNAYIEFKNISATYDLDCLRFADIILVDINIDVNKHKSEIDVPIDNFKILIQQIGSRIPETSLTIIETTVPPGTCENIVFPILKEEFLKRKISCVPLLAHSYERVMPGKNYISSIINFWRVYSGNSEQAKALTKEFLSTIINVREFPLTELSSTTESEVAKVMENSYRATNIAFIQEWAEFAEKAGVNLFSVINAIKKRKGTHDNIMRPGFGVGGYCLPKDPLLTQWAAKVLFDLDIDFQLSKKAVHINDKMPLHSFNILKQYFGSLRGLNILLCGVSYLPDVADIRNTPTQTLVDELIHSGANVFAHDPLLQDWSGVNKGNFFSDRSKIPSCINAMFYLVSHSDYLNDSPASLKSEYPNLELVIDSFDVLTDLKIVDFMRVGIQVRGVGKGHIMNQLRG